MEILKSLNHPDEVYALLCFKIRSCKSVLPKSDTDEELSEDLQTCYSYLNKTSRSFAAVIQALDGDLRHAVCIFYLVLRALDTVEDDMSMSLEEKVPMLKAFHTYLWDPQWRYMNSSEKDRIVLENFPVISGEFRKLSSVYQKVISDICCKMGNGMTVFLDKSPNDLQEWDEYCHYVAGLVGIGLSQLFSASGLEDSVVGEDTDLANSMGLFLQKTNIIRDYLEDVLQGRHFWPKQVWGKYGKEMKDLLRPGKQSDAVACLNELITNALQHVPDSIKYMSRLRNQSIFNFCAIPQVMAVATLERCYNNLQVFSGVVKIRKGEAVKLMMSATNISSVKAIMTHFSAAIQARIPSQDPCAAETRKVVTNNLDFTRTDQQYNSTSGMYLPLYVSFVMLILAIVWVYGVGITKLVDQFTD